MANGMEWLSPNKTWQNTSMRRCICRTSISAIGGLTFDFSKGARSAAVVAPANQEENTSIYPENKFRDLKFIEPLFDLHENGDKLKEIVLNGASYHFDSSIDYSAEQAEEDLYFNIDRGNNKSTMGNEEFITKSIDNEVSRGWAFPIPLNWVPLIPGIAVTPIEVAKQYTLNENGCIIPKNRITHDCSRPSKSGLSLNSRIDNDKMEECIYGMCLWRILYQIHQLRLENPGVTILLSKLDSDSAYRRMSIKFIFALMCTIVICPLSYILCSYLSESAQQQEPLLYCQTSSSTWPKHSSKTRHGHQALWIRPWPNPSFPQFIWQEILGSLVYYLST